MTKLHAGIDARKPFARSENAFPGWSQRASAGFWGMVVYWELRRISDEFNLSGLLSRQFLKPAYLANRLMWRGRVTAVTNGVTAVTEAGLLVSAGENVYQLLESANHSALTNAERQRKFRNHRKMSNGALRRVTARNGPLDTPLSAGEPKNASVTVSNAEAVCGQSPAAGTEEQRSLPLLIAVPSVVTAPRKRKQPTGDPNHRPLLEALLAAFQEAKGRGYGMDGGADAKAVTRLLGISRDQEEHVRRWRNALALDRYPGCASIKLFAQRWNELGDVQTDEERAIRLGELRALTERVTQRERIRHY